MVFAEEDKEFAKNLYPIKGCGLKRFMREFNGKRWKRPGLTNPRKTVTSKRMQCMVVVDRGQCVTSCSIGLKFVRWRRRKENILNTENVMRIVTRTLLA